jgi:tetratricopeptide (TPR) repeat protein
LTAARVRPVRGRSPARRGARQALAEEEARADPAGPGVAAAAVRAARQCWRLGLCARGLPLAERGLALHAAAARGGPDSLPAAEAGELAALLLLGLGRLEEAARRMEESLRRREAAAGRQDPGVAAGLGRLGDILLRLGRPAEARACQARANGIMAAAARRAERAARGAAGRAAEEEAGRAAAAEAAAAAGREPGPDRAPSPRGSPGP